MQIPIALKNDTVKVGKSNEKWQKTRVRKGRDLVFLVVPVLVLVVVVVVVAVVVVVGGGGANIALSSPGSLCKRERPRPAAVANE